MSTIESGHRLSKDTAGNILGFICINILALYVNNVITISLLTHCMSDYTHYEINMPNWFQPDGLKSCSRSLLVLSILK